jgi:predicted amidophosphoribosyltransferase
MELALAARDVLLVPRCAGCDEPGSWFCVSRDECEPVAHDLARGVMVDVIVPVPLHRSRAAARGYDQAALLAHALAARAGLPLRPALHRIRARRPQVELDRAARAANIRGAFVAEVGALRGLRVALGDDAATTGATLADAAAAARAAGAGAVRADVVAVEE